MSCNCLNNIDTGKELVDLVRSKGKDNFTLKVSHIIDCSCGSSFTMHTLVDKCPNCSMTYGVTPCSQGDKNNIKSAGINY